VDAPPVPSLRIGFDATPLRIGQSAGTANYLARLIEALLTHPSRPQLSLFCAGGWTPALETRAREWEALAPGRCRVTARWFSRSSWASLGGARWNPMLPSPTALTGAVDVFHAGDGAWPRHDATPLVASVLDVTPVLFPAFHTAANRFHHWRKLRWIRASARRIQCISHATSRDVVATVGVPEERIDVIPLARGLPLSADRPEARRRIRQLHGLGDHPYILCTGTLEPRKNHLRLLEAFEIIAAEQPDLHLVLAGATGWHTSTLASRLRRSPVGARIRCVGFCPTEDLWALYREARLFAYPSLYEGFGLPLLEAMAVGTPVVTSSVASMPEVAGPAAAYCDPTSVASIAEALRAVLEDPALHGRLAAAGPARERSFTWERTAELTLASYLRAITPEAV